MTNSGNNVSLLAENPCLSLNCTHLCLLRPRDGGRAVEAVCACPEMHIQEGNTCRPNCDSYVLVFPSVWLCPHKAWLSHVWFYFYHVLVDLCVVGGAHVLHPVDT